MRVPSLSRMLRSAGLAGLIRSGSTAPGTGRLRLSIPVRPLRWLRVLGLALMVMTAPLMAAPKVQANLDRSVITPGDVAVLTISIIGEDARPVLPQVPGLHIALVGQRVSSQYYGGGNSQTTFSRTYEIIADHEGDFSIAPITVDGVQLSPVRLKVSASVPHGLASTQGGGTGGGATSGAAADEKHALPFMRVVLPRTRLYVGEEVPIQIKAYFREGTEARMEGALAVNSDAFTASGLDDHPTRGDEVIDGQPWVVLTWTSVLGAIKSGDYLLNVELPLLVRLRVGGDASMQQRLQALLGMAHINGFSDDDLDEAFGRQVERHLVLKPPATTVHVLPLPTAGQPADFSGAVGHFNVSAAVAPAAGAVGEPLTLTVIVSGQGNLSRINTPGLADSPQWRTYRPDVRMTAGSGGTAPSKTFAQPIVPRMAGSLVVPGIPLSWFDPDTGRYETRQTPAFTVAVGPARGLEAQSHQGAASDPAAASPDSAPASTAATIPGRQATRPVEQHARSLRPLIREPAFLALLGAPVAGLLLALLWRLLGGRISRASSSSGAGTRTARHWLALMDAAITREDAVEFFEVARRALREHPPTAPEAAQPLLDAADQVAYGGGVMPGAQLRQWRELMAVLLSETRT